MPKKDSRLMLARFNEQLQPLYDLLREVEHIKLAPECLEPEPVDIDLIRGIIKPNEHGVNEIWSGEATRSGGFAVEETRVDITIGDGNSADTAAPKKERPIWMTDSTVVGANDADEPNDQESLLEKVAQTSQSSAWNAKSSTTTSRGKKDEENIMSVLLAHEKQTTKANTDAVKNLNTNQDSSGGDSSGDDDDEIDRTEIRKLMKCALNYVTNCTTIYLNYSKHRNDQRRRRVGRRCADSDGGQQALSGERGHGQHRSDTQDVAARKGSLHSSVSRLLRRELNVKICVYVVAKCCEIKIPNMLIRDEICVGSV